MRHRMDEKVASRGRFLEHEAVAVASSDVEGEVAHLRAQLLKREEEERELNNLLGE